jgi:hypothetical protein
VATQSQFFDRCHMISTANHHSPYPDACKTCAAVSRMRPSRVKSDQAHCRERSDPQLARPTHYLGTPANEISSCVLLLRGSNLTTSKGTPPTHAKYRQGTSECHDEELQSTIATPNPPTASLLPPRIQPSQISSIG